MEPIVMSLVRSLGPSCQRRFSQAVVGLDVFDRRAKKFHRDRTAQLPDAHVYQYVHEEMAYRLADRVYDIRRYFPLAVDVGCGLGHMSPHIFKENVGHLIQTDLSDEMLLKAKQPEEISSCRIAVDEEKWPFRPKSLDLVLSNLNLHWINDIPGFFRSVYHSLKDDGVFMASMFGGETLYQLRVSLQLAEQERLGGLSAHISPFTEAPDISSLLNAVGFRMLTIDMDELEVSYPNIMALMKDLQGMGENGAAWKRCPHLHRDVITAADCIYKEMYGREDGTLPATFQVLFMIGWRPGKDMPQPAKRGSATVSLKDISKLFAHEDSKSAT